MYKKILVVLLASFSVLLIAGLFSSKSVYTEIEIDATADDVWKKLTSFEHYPQWNPFIIRVAGDLSANSPIDVTINSRLAGEMDFNLTLGRLEPQREMVWIGQTLFPKLLDGEHHFRIEPVDEGRVRFSQEEFYSGLFLYPSWLFVSSDSQNNFEAMNIALKKSVETD